jgi:uncharacterized protein YkwD
MDYEERISTLETGMARLEVTVEAFVKTVATERTYQKEMRDGDREALRELGSKVEKSITSLTLEMQKLADKGSAIDANVLMNQSKALGAVGTLRWVVGILLAVAGLIGSYQMGKNNERGHSSPQPEPIERTR